MSARVREAGEEPSHESFHSLDGRRFTGEVPLGASLLVGDFVVVRPPGSGRLLGQVVEKTASGDAARVTGVLRASVDPAGGIGPVALRPFADATVEAPGLDLHAAYQGWREADLVVGTTRSGGLGSVEEVPALLRRSAFNRHTFLCGQSGSGKTYALGVILEQLLAETSLQLLVIDPNADFVGLGSARPDADPVRLDRLGVPDVRVLRAGRSRPPADQDGQDDQVDEGQRLAVRFSELSVATRAAALHVDPLADREEYNGLLRILDSAVDRQRIEHFVAELEGSGGGAVGQGIAQRIQNLGILDWDIWARDDRSLLETVDAAPRAVVLDVAGCPVPQERSIAAAALLDHLWDRRTGRQPVLLVIDEAHNLCPAEPSDPVQALVTARLVQIAAEGRKYGLWLLLSTQQPHKVHPHVLSQCDNLVVMRMGSATDLARLGEVFGTAPRQMLAAATDFSQGEMLLAGGFVAAPMIARVAARLTVEGGEDVPVPLRTG